MMTIRIGRIIIIISNFFYSNLFWKSCFAGAILISWYLHTVV